jgi:hypothetical protein
MIAELQQRAKSMLTEDQANTAKNNIAFYIETISLKTDASSCFAQLTQPGTCFHILQTPLREDDITRVTALTKAQKAILKALGALEFM